MPYIITTERTGVVHGSNGQEGAFEATLSRRAVATLEEARHHLIDTVADAVTLDCAPGRLTAAGGTIGPLPDGTTIKVHRVGRIIEREQFALRAMLSPRATDEEWCDAWNAKHGTEA